MQYRKLGNTGLKVSALGFGAMRLPTLEGGAIDEPEAIRMIRYGIDQGINYIDTGYPYHGGESERLLGKALQDGYREKVILATKMPLRPGGAESREDMDRIFDEQLAKLQTDHVDIYLLHGLRQPRWEKVHEYDWFEWAERQVQAGRIHHLGFSFHDDLALFKEIIDAYPWAMCQIQYNYMNEEHQAGTEGLEYAASKGIGVVVMEPLLGGKLANPPWDVQTIWDEAPVRRNAPEWALQWLWDKPEVSVALSGMSTMEQLQQNIESAGRSGVGQLSEAELAAVSQARDTYRKITPIPCTTCQYCMPCPNGVNIPGNFTMLNEGVMYNNMDGSRRRYERMEEGSRASACIQCRICEEKCPQDIVISEWMPYVDEVLGQGVEFDAKVAATIG